MKKIIFGIFAHPDDEAFGPCGTLIKEVRQGAELHLITLTAGENGTNPDALANLGHARLEEWHKASNLIGAAQTYHLGYTDGTLTNTDMQQIAKKVEEIVHAAINGRTDVSEIEFMTLDLNGLTGHIDHIVAARAACFVFYRLKSADDRLSKIRFYCLSARQYPSLQTDWIYMEPGRSPNEIDETVDAREFHDEITDTMHAHNSQRQDCENQIERMSDELGLDHFIVKR